MNSTIKDQDTLQAKELQKFFMTVKAVYLDPKSDNDVNHHATLCLVVDKATYQNFRDYNIHQCIVDLLDNKFPVIFIKIPLNRDFIGLSIKDEETGLTFKLPEQPLTEQLVDFLQHTKYDDKIPMMLGYIEEESLVLNKDMKKNLLLILDGYRFE